jgi:hypothetical protein
MNDQHTSTRRRRPLLAVVLALATFAGVLATAPHQASANPVGTVSWQSYRPNTGLNQSRIGNQGVFLVQTGTGSRVALCMNPSASHTGSGYGHVGQINYLSTNWHGMNANWGLATLLWLPTTTTWDPDQAAATAALGWFWNPAVGSAGVALWGLYSPDNISWWAGDSDQRGLINAGPGGTNIYQLGSWNSGANGKMWNIWNENKRLMGPWSLHSPSFDISTNVASVQLRNGLGAGISGRTVAFDLPGGGSVFATTDSSGWASATIPTGRNGATTFRVDGAPSLPELWRRAGFQDMAVAGTPQTITASHWVDTRRGFVQVNVSSTGGIGTNGAQFQLRNNDGVTLDTQTVANGSHVSFGNINLAATVGSWPHTYTVHQVATPAGHVPMSGQVGSINPISTDVFNPSVVNVTNTALRHLRVNVPPDGLSVNGTVITLRDANGNDIGSQTVNNNSHVLFSNINPVGRPTPWRVYQTSTAAGYVVVNPSSIMHSLGGLPSANSSSPTTMTITNTASRHIRVDKTSMAGLSVNGASFELRDNSGGLIATQTVSNNANVTFANINPLGRPLPWRINETVAPAGHFLPANPVHTLNTLPSSLASNPTVVSVSNSAGRYMRIVVNSDAGLSAVGTTFVIRDANGVDVASRTVTAGNEVNFNGVTMGGRPEPWTLHQTATAPGHTAVPSSVNIVSLGGALNSTVTPTSTAIISPLTGFVFTPDPATSGTVTVSLQAQRHVRVDVSSTGGLSVNGAAFQLRAANNAVIASGTISNGANLPLGNINPTGHPLPWTLHQTAVSPGHLNPTNPVWDLLSLPSANAAAPTVIPVLNTINFPNRYLRIVMQPQGGVPLDGTVIELRDGSDDVVGTAVLNGGNTQANFTIDNTFAGPFTVHQTAVAPGYIPVSNPRITINEALSTDLLNPTIRNISNWAYSHARVNVTSSGGLDVDGATFQIRDAGNNVVATQTVTNGSHVLFSNVNTLANPAPYSIHQTAVPAGHLPVANPVATRATNFSFDPNNPTVIDVTNNVIPPPIGHLRVDKISSASLDVDGATFELRDLNGNVVGTQTITNNASVTFSNINQGINPGPYTLHETVVPAGHVDVANPVAVIMSLSSDPADPTVATVNNDVITTVEPPEDSPDVFVYIPESATGASFVAHGSVYAPRAQVYLGGGGDLQVLRGGVVASILTWSGSDAANPLGYEIGFHQRTGGRTPDGSIDPTRPATVEAVVRATAADSRGSTSGRTSITSSIVQRPVDAERREHLGIGVWQLFPTYSPLDTPPVTELPGAPVDLTASSDLPNGEPVVTLTWGAPSNAASAGVANYDVQFRMTDGQWAFAGARSVTNTTLTGLATATQYEMRVRARGAGGVGPWSNVVTTTTLGEPVIPAIPLPPGAPTDLVALTGEGEIVVSWQLPTNQGTSPISGFEVSWSRSSNFNGGSGNIIPVTASPFVHTGRVPGNQYFYRVRAINLAGTGPWSATVAATAVGAPSTPSSLAVTPGNSQASLAWGSAADNGSPITGYELAWSTNAEFDGQSVISVTGTSYTHADLTNGTTYFYRVRAVNTIGAGPWSLPAQVTPFNPITVPGVPQSVSVAGATGQGTVTWSTPASDGGSPVTGYQVSWSTSAGFDGDSGTIISQATSPQVIGQLTNAAVHFVRVRAINAIGTGAWSQPVQFIPAGPPGVPSGVTATGDDGKVLVTWAPPTFDGGAPVTGYDVSWSTNAGFSGDSGTIVPVETNSMTHSERSNGIAYFYRVRARNVVTHGTWSDVVSATPIGAPGAPATPSGQPGDTVNQVTWTAPSVNGGSAVTGYEISWSTAEGFSGDEGTIVGSVSSPWSHTGLVNATTYFYRVRAINAVGAGSWSGAVAITASGVPDAPGAPAAISGNGELTVAWQPPSNNGGSAVTSYTLQWATNENFSTGVGSTTVSGTSHVHTGRTNGTTYFYRVRATNPAGSGAWSDAVSATPIGPPGAVTALQAATTASGQVTLTWAAPTPGPGTAPVIEYEVAWSNIPGFNPDAIGTARTSITSTQFVHDALPVYVGHHYRVRAWSALGAGAWSTQVSVVTKGAPATPEILSVTPQEAGGLVQWTGQHDGGSPVLSTEIEWATNLEFTENVGSMSLGSTQTAAIADLEIGVPYFVRVSSENAFGWSGWSSTAELLPRGPIDVPDAPGSVVVTSGFRSLRVAWGAPEFDGGTPILGYVVGTPIIEDDEIVDFEIFCETDAETFDCVVGDIEHGDYRTFWVLAYNEVGESEAVESEPATSTPSVVASTQVERLVESELIEPMVLQVMEIDPEAAAISAIIRTDNADDFGLYLAWACPGLDFDLETMFFDPEDGELFPPITGFVTPGERTETAFVLPLNGNGDLCIYSEVGFELTLDSTAVVPHGAGLVMDDPTLVVSELGVSQGASYPLNLIVEEDLPTVGHYIGSWIIAPNNPGETTFVGAAMIAACDDPEVERFAVVAEAGSAGTGGSFVTGIDGESCLVNEAGQQSAGVFSRARQIDNGSFESYEAGIPPSLGEDDLVLVTDGVTYMEMPGGDQAGYYLNFVAITFGTPGDLYLWGCESDDEDLPELPLLSMSADQNAAQFSTIIRTGSSGGICMSSTGAALVVPDIIGHFRV